MKLPSGISFSQQQILEMQEKNLSVEVKNGKFGKSLIFNEKEFSFNEVDEIEILLPVNFSFNSNQYEKLCLFNNDLKIETDFNKMYIFMGISELIGLFTAAILAAIYTWNKINSKGAVYGESVRYDLPDVDGKIKHRMPDISFILRSKFEELVLYNNKFIQGTPTLSVEIVSSAKSVAKELKKMKNDWMNAGTEIGIVINPFEKKYFVFEKNIEKYSEFNFTKIFTHILLPDLELNFAELWNEAEQQSILFFQNKQKNEN